jgi:hypothetical protein
MRESEWKKRALGGFGGLISKFKRSGKTSTSETDSVVFNFF